MRAIRYFATGPADQVLTLVDRPLPQPGPGAVRVRVHASGVNPHDTKGRSGWSGRPVGEDGVTPHSDGAGVIEAVGAGVDPARLGQRVWLVGAHPEGTAAEAVVIAADRAIPLPGPYSFAEGAALGVPAVTAWLAVLSDGPVTGQTVLVQGTGAVGRVAVEIAARSGARVIASAGSQRGRDLARARGAQIVLDRHTDNIVDAVMQATDGQGAERIVDVDFGANQAVTVQALAAHGMVAAYSCSADRTPPLDYYGFARKSARLDFVQGARLSPAQLAASTAAITGFLEAGHLRPDLAAVLPLAQTARAHALVEAGADGNVVVTPGDPEAAAAPDTT